MEQNIKPSVGETVTFQAQQAISMPAANALEAQVATSATPVLLQDKWVLVFQERGLQPPGPKAQRYFYVSLNKFLMTRVYHSVNIWLFYTFLLQPLAFFGLT